MHKSAFIQLLLAMFCSFLLPLSFSVKAAVDQEQELVPEKEIPKKKRRSNKYLYTYVDRDHSTRENLNHLAGMYAITWVVYPLTQPDVVRDDGSIKKYKQNFGKLVFDKDEPFWNWFVHPISGSQLFLYYRAVGYRRIEALAMTFISSTLFEFTVEIYTEPASVQDLYQTPILGSVLGVGLETISLYLLNSGNSFGKILGHALNPATLFWFYEGKIKLVPQTNFSDKASLLFTWSFE